MTKSYHFATKTRIKIDWKNKMSGNSDFFVALMLS